MRAKFKVVTCDYGNVVLEPVAGAPENAAFFGPTASGRLQLGVTDRSTLKQLPHGAVVDVDFTVEEASS